MDDLRDRLKDSASVDNAQFKTIVHFPHFVEVSESLGTELIQKHEIKERFITFFV